MPHLYYYETFTNPNSSQYRITGKRSLPNWKMAHTAKFLLGASSNEMIINSNLFAIESKSAFFELTRLGNPTQTYIPNGHNCTSSHWSRLIPPRLAGYEPSWSWSVEFTPVAIRTDTRSVLYITPIAVEPESGMFSVNLLFHISFIASVQ